VKFEFLKADIHHRVLTTHTRRSGKMEVAIR
jgi:hypothetical protein